MAHIATLAQISDLHFIDELTERGRRLWIKQLGTKSHDYLKLTALGDKFDEFQKARRYIDLILATGDISTDGRIASLETAKRFLAGDDVDTGSSGSIKGLRALPERRVILPGNHDRYGGYWFPLQYPSKDFESVFGLPNGPYAAGYRPPSFAAAPDPSAPALLFFVFDSTLTYSSMPKTWKRVARGLVDVSARRWLRSKAGTIEALGQVNGVDNSSLAINYDAAIRIAVLHHHPVNDPHPPTGFGARIGQYTSLMEEAQEFIEACFDVGIDLVLFGHQHRKYPDMIPAGARKHTKPYAHDMYLFCCASTSEFSLQDNSFYLIDFTTKDFTVRSFTWNSTAGYQGDSFSTEDSQTFLYTRDIPWLE